uniref:Secreted protein n=1 Tax=Populus trichocarpa TaxID=3694 RepID=A0A3N7FWJ3_POPTR
MSETIHGSCFLLSFFCFPLNSHVSLGADTISANSSLSRDQTIVSARKVFELVFFHPGSSLARQE